MENIHKKNFYKRTYCKFDEVEFNFTNKKIYVSKSGSKYHYTDKGVYRYSNHWGRVADCRWNLVSETYKSQNWYTGYAQWEDFYNLDSLKKKWFLVVDYSTKKVLLSFENSQSDVFLFTINQCLKRKKEIETIFKEPSFLKYCNDPALITKKIIIELKNSNTSLQKIKHNCLSQY